VVLCPHRLPVAPAVRVVARKAEVHQLVAPAVRVVARGAEFHQLVAPAVRLVARGAKVHQLVAPAVQLVARKAEFRLRVAHTVVLVAREAQIHVHAPRALAVSAAFAEVNAAAALADEGSAIGALELALRVELPETAVSASHAASVPPVAKAETAEIEIALLAVMGELGDHCALIPLSLLRHVLPAAERRSAAVALLAVGGFRRQS